MSVANEKKSVDMHSAQIVFLCSINQACIIWQSILDKQMELSIDEIKKLTKLIEKALSLCDGVSDELQQLLHLHCVRSIGFLKLNIYIAVKVLKGELPDKLEEKAFQMLRLLSECIIAASTTKECPISDGSMEWFTNGLENVKPNIVQNPSQVESTAQDVILLLLFQFVLSKEIIEIHEIEECQPMLSTFQSSSVPCVSIRTKAVITVLKRKAISHYYFTPMELTSTELEFIAEILFEMAASKSRRHLSFSSGEILQVYKELIASNPIVKEAFEAFNVLDEDDFTELQVSAGFQAMQLKSSGASIASSEGFVFKRLLDEFRSSLEDDPDGSLWLVTALLTEANSLIESAEKKYKAMDFQAVNTVKTIVSVVLDTVIYPKGDSQQLQKEIHVVNHIAKSDKLVGALLLILQGHGRFSVPAFGILISLSLELILVQCACTSEKFRFKFSKAGGLKYLQFQLHEASNDEFNKFTEHIITGHLVILFKSIYEDPERMYPMLSKPLCLKSIMRVINAPNIGVRICSKTVLSLFLIIMDNTDKASLQLTADEASHLIKLLGTASNEGEANEGIFTYTLVELLISLINLSSLPQNKVTIAEKGILKHLEFLILSEQDYKVKEKSLCLLWTLLSGSDLCTRVLIDHQDLRLMLRFISKWPSITLFLFSWCALKEIYWDSPEDIHSMYLYAYASSLCGQLDESISLCQLVLKHHSQNSLASHCELLLGKCLARKYSQEQMQLEFNQDYFSAAEFGKNEAIKTCYAKARSVIMLLGRALDNQFLDEEGSMLLDFAMIDYSREVNALNECSRCFLCRKHKKLHRSHICPVSVLKEIAKATYSNPTKATITTITGRHEVKTPRSETKWLLCGTCEELLSQHGETQFIHFFRLLYPNIKSTSISYKEDLYNFCVGVAFRTLSLTNFSYLHNTSEIYDFIVTCRNHLISLSEDRHNSPKMNNPEFFLFRNPIGLYSTEEVRELILSDILQSNFQVHVSMYHLHTGLKSPIAEACFFMVILGGIIMLTKFSPDHAFVMPESFVPILPEGGEYIVPDEAQRWSDIPLGVMEIFKESVLEVQSRISEVFWGKIPLSNRHKSSQIPPSWDTEIANHPGPHISNELKYLQQNLLLGIMHEEITKTNLLPEGFNISKNPPISRVVLPPGHTILRHTYDRKKDVTVLLAADCEGCYAVVIHCKNRREITYGFRLRETEDNYMVKGLLVASSVEGADSAFLSGMISPIKNVLESLWNDFGSFEGLIHHSEVERACEGSLWVSLDHRCSDGGCWYCLDRCHNCFKPVNAGYTKKDENIAYQHCSERCMSLYFNNQCELPALVDLLCLKVKTPLIDTALLLLTKVVSTKLSANTLLCIQLCLSRDHHRIPNGALLALVQVRTTKVSNFLSFIISPDMSPGEPLWYSNTPEKVDAINDFRSSGVIQEALQLALAMNGISDVLSFIRGL